jgi:hypothetical protein
LQAVAADCSNNKREVLGLKRVYALRKILREIALKKPGLIVPVYVTDEMNKEADNLAFEAEEITKRKHVLDIFDGKTISERIGGYLGQFAFHHFQSGDWRNAISYIRKELKQIEEGKEIEGADAEIDGRSIDIKTTDLRRKYLAFNPPFPFGLQVPEIQARHKIHDFYVLVFINPPIIIKKYGYEASIFGYAYGNEIEETRAIRYSQHLTLNRSIPFLDLHPMRFLKPGLWNTEEARKTTLKDE